MEHHTFLICMHRYMPVILGVIIGLMLMGTTDGAYSFGYYRNSNHPGKCYINESMILSPGEVRYFKSCTKLECKSEQGEATMVSCGVFAPPPGCTYYYPKADEDYPNCCEIAVICPHENDVDHDHSNAKHDDDNDDSKKESTVSPKETEKDLTTKTATTDNNVDLTTPPTTEKDLDLVSTTLGS